MSNEERTELIIRTRRALAAWREDETNEPNFLQWYALDVALSASRSDAAANKAELEALSDDSDLGEAPFDTRREMGV
jgi:hypothetical protein